MSEKGPVIAVAERLPSGTVTEFDAGEGEIVNEDVQPRKDLIPQSTNPENPAPLVPYVEVTPIILAPGTELPGSKPGTDVVPYVPKSDPDPKPTSNPTRLTFTTVDQTVDARHAALDEADRRLDRELNDGDRGRFKRIKDLVWKGNIAKDYYRQKYAVEAERRIRETGDIYIHEEGDAGVRRSAQLATVERFQSEYEETLHDLAGERRNDIKDPELADAIKALIRRNVSPNPGEEPLSDDNLREECTRILDIYAEANQGENQGVLGEGAVRVNNMVELAQAVKGAVEHGESLAAVLDNMRFVTGEARSGVRTDNRLNMLDRTVENLTKSRIGLLVGPETITAATTLTYSALKWSGNTLAGAALKTIAPFVGAGVLAGIRENMRVKNERAQNSREAAQGKDTPGKAREKMGLYDMPTATSLAEQLERLTYGSEADLSSEAAVRAALDALGSVEVRIQIADEEDTNLSKSSATTSIESERFALDVARAQAKVALNAHLDPATRRALGLDEHAPLAELLRGPAALAVERIRGNMSTQDEVFQKHKALRVAGAAAIGAGGGVVVGGIVQEVWAMASGTRTGLVEQIWNADNRATNGVEHQTMANSIANNLFGSGDMIHHGPEAYVDLPLGELGHGTISGDLAIDQNPDGTFNLKGHGGNVLAENIAVQPDGSLAPETIEALKHTEGIDFQDHSTTVELPTQDVHKEVSFNEYMEAHRSETTAVTRDSWLDNNTPAPLFDKNEQGLHLGGINGTGLTGDGGYQFDITTMTADGSRHASESVEWQQAAAAGELKLALSASENTQNQVFMIDIGPDGKPTIPPNTPAAQLFSEQNGKAVFNGKYAEVVHVGGVDANGVTHMRPLATHVGNNSALSGVFGIDQQVTPKEFKPDYQITSLGYDTPAVTDVPPIIPIIPRRSMEPARKSPNETSPPEAVPPVLSEGADINKPKPIVPPVELQPKPAPAELGGRKADVALPPAAARYGLERARNRERVLPRSRRPALGTGRRALPRATAENTVTSSPAPEVYRGRGLGREILGPEGAAPRAVESGPSRTPESSRPASAPGNGTSRPRAAAPKRQKGGLSPEDTERYANRLGAQLNSGGMPIRGARAQATYHFGESGYSIEGSEAEGYRVIVNDQGREYAQKSRDEKTALRKARRNSTAQ